MASAAAGTERAVGAPAVDYPRGSNLFDRIRAFLIRHQLDPHPDVYSFAYAVVVNPYGRLARAVAAKTADGARLTRRDIEALLAEMRSEAVDPMAQADELVASTKMQVEQFDDTLHEMRAETEDFGRALAASADAILRTSAELPSPGGPIETVARITTTMVERVQAAEAKLEKATRESAELREKLEEARDNARRDPLTGLVNRRAFEEAYAEKIAAGEALCVAVADIDHFKSVNDRFGHAVGDRVIKAIASALTITCEGHLVSRYGGEEFVVLFSGIDAGAARETLERARLSVENKRYKLRENDQPLGAVTFSAGLICAVADESVQSAFQRADALLYTAKAAGRNNIKVG